MARAFNHTRCIVHTTEQKKTMGARELWYRPVWFMHPYLRAHVKSLVSQDSIEAFQSHAL